MFRRKQLGETSLFFRFFATQNWPIGENAVPRLFGARIPSLAIVDAITATRIRADEIPAAVAIIEERRVLKYTPGGAAFAIPTSERANGRGEFAIRSVGGEPPSWPPRRTKRTLGQACSAARINTLQVSSPVVCCIRKRRDVALPPSFYRGRSFPMVQHDFVPCLSNVPTAATGYLYAPSEIAIACFK